MILALVVVCLLSLSVGCVQKGQTDAAGVGSGPGDSSTTIAARVASLDPALLGKWQAIDPIPARNADYLGPELDFRITSDDEGNPTGQLLTPTGNGVTGYGDLYAVDGVMRFGGYVEAGGKLEANYTIEGDTLTIVPLAATGLAPAAYGRVVE